MAEEEQARSSKWQKETNGETDVELAEVRLLSQPEETSGNDHSWYSANGRGHSVNGTQTETAGGVSHVATVLGEAFYARERRNQQVWDCITNWPHRAFNTPALVLAVCVILLVTAMALRNQHSSPAETVGLEWQSGSQSMEYGLNHDFRGRPRRVEATDHAVAADHGRCSDLGARIMDQGGNAVDALVATALCQGVMNPMASGIGGGTIMLIRLPNGTSTVIDAREVAPAAANETMFSGNWKASLLGGLAVAVPLELKGLWKAHQMFGSAAWATLVTPSADLARDGFEAHPYLIKSIEASLNELQQDSKLRSIYLKPSGSEWRAPRLNESCCVRPQLAALLDDVAKDGPSALYSGSRAQGLVSEIQAAGGVLTLEDLVTAEPQVKAALRSQVFGLDIIVPPPPSSAAAVITALHILEGYAIPLSFLGGLGYHRFVEAMKSGFAFRTHFGDPGNCSDPTSSSCFLNLTSTINASISKEYAEVLRKQLKDNFTQSTPIYGGAWHANSTIEDDHGTSHMSVVDKDRIAVSMTSTVNTRFGSLLYSNTTGLLLNNQMDDFSTPGQDNTYGLAPSKANFIRPGKKPLSSMSPTMLAEPNGGPLRIVVGASGGPRIVSAVLTTILRLITQGQDPLLAVAGPRLHHQLLPDVVLAERWKNPDVSFMTPDSVIEALQVRGHTVKGTSNDAITQVITVDPDTSKLIAVSDPRKDGAPSGK